MTALLVGVTFVVLTATALPDDRATVECTFQHPQYAGSCVETVTPEKDQTPVAACRVVLACLNDTRCVKTYCKATTIRGGWTLVSPKAEPQRP